MSIEAALSFFLAIVIFSITPGPGVFAILARALTHGAKACVWLAFGMTVSDALYLVAACFGLAAIATHWGGVFTLIRILGAVYLIYLGWKMWSAPVAELQQVEAGTRRSSALLSFVQGFMISASNPKVILFYIAFLPTFIELTTLTGVDIVLLVGLTLLGLMIGLMLIALFAARARRWFRSERATRRLNRSAGSIMAGAGLFLFSRS